MAFNSAQFLIFFPVVTIVFFVLPKKIKYLWLLLVSYYFYMCWNATYVLLILTSTIITFISSLLIEKVRNGSSSNTKLKLKIIVSISLFLNLAILFYFKYANLMLQISWFLLTKLGITLNLHQTDVLLPVGISFYTLQALGYTIDVYRGDIYAERNFFKYALFVSFFPQLVAGPIERSKNLLTQLSGNKRFNFESAREGFLLMLWGYFLKLVIADRTAILVDTVYNDTAQFSGIFVVLATILFAFQIYCDFAGYSTIAMGAAKILGIELMDNFHSPLLSTSISDFWRRWHVSLTSWFKDYLYIPLGGSRAGKLRKHINIMIIFLISGLWHGASLSYVVWGGLNGLYQIIGNLLMPIRNKFVQIFKLNRNSIGHKCISVICTFILFDFSLIFFRSGTISKAIEVLKAQFRVNNIYIMFNGSIYNCGLDIKNYWVMLLGIITLLIVDFIKLKGIRVRDIIISQDFWFRWLIIDFAIIIILVFGIWGSTYDSANFIYFQF